MEGTSGSSDIRFQSAKLINQILVVMESEIGSESRGNNTSDSLEGRHIKCAPQTKIK